MSKDRLKDAEWFDEAPKHKAIVIGAGGIGSFLSLLLSRVGANLIVYDGDIVSELNMGGQLYSYSDINKRKVSALANIINNFDKTYINTYYAFYDESSSTSKVVFLALDNMKTRKIAFLKWKNYVLNSSDEERKKCILFDGRLTAEMFQILIIQGSDINAINNYETNYLFDDSVVEDAPCTFKQTSHMAAMIGSFMTGFYTNWLANVKNQSNIYNLPFYTEYYLPLNKTTILENA